MIVPLIFGISIFGIIYMIAMWTLEERRGRRIFLPEWLVRHDDAVRMFSWWTVLRLSELFKKTYAYMYQHVRQAIVYLKTKLPA